MTAVCVGGGPSQAKAGYQDPIFWTTSGIAAFFNALPSPWALDFVSYLGPQQIDPSEFCTEDPPADPMMSALDWAQVVQIANPFIQTPALFKLSQLFRRLLWFQICECVSGAQPSPPAAPSPPSGLIAVNPPAIGGDYPTGTPCLSAAETDTSPASTNTVTQTALTPIPVGATYAAVDAQWRDGAEVLTTFAASWFWYTSAGALISSIDAGATYPTVNHHAEGAIPATATQYRLHRQVSTGATAETMQSQYALYCGTTPGGGGGLIPVPCPPDPVAQALLQQILGLVTLIQRQAVPFAYVASAAHTGLAGDGHFDVQGLIGVRVLLTDFGSNTAVYDGDPLTYQNAGWITWSNPSGAMHREPIGASPMVSMPRLAGQFTRIGYTLLTGVEATITELVREQ